MERKFNKLILLFPRELKKRDGEEREGERHGEGKVNLLMSPHWKSK